MTARPDIDAQIEAVRGFVCMIEHQRVAFVPLSHAHAALATLEAAKRWATFPIGSVGRGLALAGLRCAITGDPESDDAG